MEKEFIKDRIKEILEASPFYQKKINFKIIDRNDFNQYPFTTKNEIIEDQKMHPPFGSNLCYSINKVRRIHKTSGTTNKPILICLSEDDIEKTLEIGGNCFINAGVQKNDVVVHCLNYNMWSGGVTDHLCLERAGAAVVPFGVGQTKNLIETILQIGPTAIHCTPSYISKIEVILKNEFNLKPIDLNLRLGLFGAESGLQNLSFRRNLESKWGFKAMNANYGLSEVLSMLASESTGQNGLEFIAGKYVYAELIDLGTKDTIEIKEHARGELVLTNINKECMPLIKYRTGDIIDILNSRPRINNSKFTFKVIGRTDDMFVIKGINIFLSAIEDYIASHLDKLTGKYQVFINKTDPIVDILIKLEYKNDISIKYNIIKEYLEKDFKNKFEVKPIIDLCSIGTIPQTDGKSKKLFREL